MHGPTLHAAAASTKQDACAKVEWLLQLWPEALRGPVWSAAGLSVLHVAAAEGNTDVIRLLVAKGMDVNIVMQDFIDEEDLEEYVSVLGLVCCKWSCELCCQAAVQGSGHGCREHDAQQTCWSLN
jgi:hypothetical protein